MNPKISTKHLLATVITLALGASAALADSHETSTVAAVEQSPHAMPMMQMGRMSEMREKMQAIIDTNDPVERQRLFKEHQKSMHERMQAMRGNMSERMKNRPNMPRGTRPNMGPMHMTPGAMNFGNMRPRMMRPWMTQNRRQQMQMPNFMPPRGQMRGMMPNLNRPNVRPGMMNDEERQAMMEKRISEMQKRMESMQQNMQSMLRHMQNMNQR